MESIEGCARRGIRPSHPPESFRIVGLGRFPSGLSDRGSGKKHLKQFGGCSRSGSIRARLPSPSIDVSDNIKAVRSADSGCAASDLRRSHCRERSLIGGLAGAADLIVENGPLPNSLPVLGFGAAIGRTFGHAAARRIDFPDASLLRADALETGNILAWIGGSSSSGGNVNPFGPLIPLR